MARFAPYLPWVVLPLIVLAVFGRLVIEPGGLLVDGGRATIDEFVSPGEQSVGNDLTRLFLPLHWRIAREVARDGSIPGWDPAGFGGRPLVGNPQASLWYPPVWLAWWSGSLSALGWLTVAHLILAALGTYRLGRDVSLGRLAAVVAGGCYALAPYMLAQVGEGHYPHVWVACWYPWAFLAFRRWRRGDRTGALAMAAILALSVAAGHLQEAFYEVVVLGTWTLRDVVADWRGGRRRVALSRSCGWIGLTTLAAGLSAVEWLPVLEHRPWLHAAQGASGLEGEKYHWHPLNLLQLLSPRALGGPADYFGHVSYWEALLSFGWVALVLAAVAVLVSPRRGEVRGWLILTLATVIFAAGPWLGLSSLLGSLVPGIGRFRVPARSLFLASLGVSVLTGLGLDALRCATTAAFAARLAHAYRRLTLGLVCALLVGSLAAEAWGGLQAPRDGEATATVAPWVYRYALREADRWLLACDRIRGDHRFWIGLIGALSAFDWLRHRPSDRNRVVALLGCMALLELGAHGVALLRVTSPMRLLGSDPVARAFERERPGGPFRIRARDAYFSDLRAVAAGLEKTNFYDQFQLQHAADLYEPLYSLLGPVPPRQQRNPGLRRRYASLRRAVIERLGVAFLVSDRPQGEVPWPVIAGAGPSGSGPHVYRNPDPLPRSYVVPRAEVWPDEASTVRRFLAVPAREAVFLPVDPFRGVPGPRQPFTPASYHADGPDRVIVRVTTRAPGLLVVADTWMPGWHATHNGRRVPILKGNRAQRVIVLAGAGRHEVILRYEPPGLLVGRAVTAGSLLVWLLAWLGRLRPSRAFCAATTRLSIAP
jgi:hypothetical protein